MFSAASNGPSFVEFESGQVRPIAMSPDGNTLFAVNTPNGTLEIFNVTAGGLAFQARVPVGMEPVAVAARSNSEVWVVNHLSDSVSIVSLSGTPRVVRTCWWATSRAISYLRAHPQKPLSLPRIGASSAPILPSPAFRERAIRSSPRAALRGRTCGYLIRPAPATASGERPLRIMSFFTDTPRALAVSPDRNTVYVAGFKTGNQTTRSLSPWSARVLKPALRGAGWFHLARRQSRTGNRCERRARARGGADCSIQQGQWALGKMSCIASGTMPCVLPFLTWMSLPSTPMH